MSIDALLAATPEPPDFRVDPADILALGEAMIAARQEILRQATPCEVDPEKLERLQALDRRWQAVLSHARREIGERLAAAARHQRRGSY